MPGKTPPIIILMGLLTLPAYALAASEAQWLGDGKPVQVQVLNQARDHNHDHSKYRFRS